MASRETPASRLLIAAWSDNSSDSSQPPVSRPHPYRSAAHNPSMLDEHERQDFETYNSSEDAFHHLKHKQPHRSVGFWHPHMSKVRAHVLYLWARTVLVLVVAILAILSLYWAVLFRVEDNLAALVVHVVDFDGQIAPYSDVNPVVGPAVTKLVDQMRQKPMANLGYTILPASDFNNDPIAVREAVYDWKSWAAVVVNANATALLQRAVETGNSSYDPTGAVQVIIQTARDQTTVQSYILPALTTLVDEFGAAFGPMWGQMVMANTSLTRENLRKAATAVNPGVAPTMLDLRPFSPATATPAVSIGLIYLIIMAFFSFSFFLPIHMVSGFIPDHIPIVPDTDHAMQKYIKPQGHPPLHFWQLIIWRWCATIAAYFVISLTYSAISLAFQIPFWPGPASHTEPPPPWGATAYGRATFAVYWMLNFAGMTALGLACENVAMLAGQPWTALWLIFWVITNVSTSFYAVGLAPGFYRWGYAWPLHHVVRASRQLLFDLRSGVGLDFGVLLAWCAVNTALFPLCCYFMRWNTEREQRQAEKDKDRYVVKTDEGDKELPKSKGEKPPVRRRGFLRGV